MKKIVGLAIVLMISCFVFAAQSTSGATATLLQRAEDAYSKADYEKAFSYVNNALKMNEPDFKANGVAPNVALIALQTCRKLLERAEKTKDYKILDDVAGQVEKFPDIADGDLNIQIRRMQNQRIEDQYEKFVKKLEDLEQKSQKQQEEINKLYDLIGAKKKK